MTDQRRLTVGLLCDSSCITPYVGELRDWINAQPGLEAWMCVTTPARQPWGAESLPSRCVRELILRLERWRCRRSAQHMSMQPAVSLLPAPSHLEEQTSCDVLISFGGALAEAAASSALGAKVLCLGFGPDGWSADPWTGFQEVKAADAKTCFAIRWMNPSCGEPEVILSGAFPTQTYFVLNQAHLFKRAIGQLKRVLSKHADGRSLVASELSFPSPSALSVAPQTLHWLRYLWRIVARTAAGKMQTVMRREERWSVSFLDQPWQLATMAKGVEIENPSKRYFADPFIVADGDDVFCFVEDYFEEQRRGVISVLKLEGKTPRFIGHALQEDFHLSFPFVFEHEGRRYMCPETNEAREIRIYECLEFPLQWALRSVAMRNVGAVDTMIFRHEDRWWMLTNLDSAGVGEYGSELHLFYTDDPLDARWIAHPQNPLRVDPELSRNAGMFRDGKTLFRVAQARGFGSYGVRSTVFQIEDLNVNNYVERAVKTLTPTFKPGLSGTHHFHSNAGYSTWDQKRMKSTS